MKFLLPTRLVAVAAVVGVVVLAPALALGPALRASADDSSTTAFVAGYTPSVTYGTNWLIEVKVTGSNPEDFVTGTSGTVNVLVEGQPGIYISSVPLTDGGVAYISPPSSKPPLGAGTYNITAVYVPSGTAYLAASQTAVPAMLTVTALSMSSSFSVNKTTIDNKPRLQVVAAASPPNANSAIPAGSWRVTAKTSSGQTAYTGTAPLAANPADPVTITLGSSLKPGDQYTISAAFVPAAAVASGYQVTNGDPKVVTVEGQSFGEAMSTPLAAPIWAVVLIAIGLAALVAAAIVLLVLAVKKSSDQAGTGAEA